MAGPLVADRRWVRQAFLLKSKDFEKIDARNRFWSDAAMKFISATPGGSFPVNPVPQFTRWADRPVKGLVNGMGIGRGWSEWFDDNQQIIHMRFGIPQFNSMTTFFAGFYNAEAGAIARTGRSTPTFYTIGKLAGMVCSVLNWKILAVHLIGYGLRFAMQKPSSKYYFLKPTMPLYYNAAQTILNQIAVNMGIVPRLFTKDNGKGVLDGGYEFDDNAKAKLHSLIPDIFTSAGNINLYAMMNKAQRLARIQQKRAESELNTYGFDLGQKIQQIYAPGQNIVAPAASYENYLKKWFGATNSQPVVGSKNYNDTGSTEIASYTEADNAGFSDFLLAELDDGAAFVTFRVNSTGPVSESWNNSVTDSDIQQKLNGIAASSRSTYFNFAGGNISDGLIGKAVGGALTAAKDLVTGVADGLGMSGLVALGGSAFVDIPKRWESSVYAAPRMNYTVNLVSPYGNPMSRLLNLYVPLSLLLAAALPVSTGTQSYTSPFLLELYDKGRCQTRLGMIDSLAVTRGTGNTGFNKDGEALAIEVSFSIVDLSSVMHMPIHAGFTMSATEALAKAGAVAGGVAGAIGGSAAGPVGTVAGGAAGAAGGAAAGAAAGQVVDAASYVANTISNVFDDDNAFSDYCAVLGSMNVYDQIYTIPRFKARLTMARAQWSSWYSKAHYASWLGDSGPGRLASIVFRGTAR